MLQKLKSLVSLDNPFRLGYHFFRAVAANITYGFPSRDMTIIGVTGTNGKTTTSNIIAAGLRANGKNIFMYTTVNIILGDKEFTNNSKMTSPDAFELQKWLAEAKKIGCEIAIIETASHGIKMHRNWGINYDISVLTNITQDHLDLHRTMDDYVQTKLKIFKNLMYYKRKTGVKKTGIINMESAYKDVFLAETYDSLFTYGLSYDANIRASNIVNTQESMDFLVTMPGKNIQIKTQLRGNFNVSNILAAIGVFASLGIERDTIAKIISEVKTIPGRMEQVKSNEGFSVFIDYAHTADALENVLETLGEMKGEGRIITVFGCTGDRDTSKRPIMGQVVSKLSDVVIVTQDDDYTENPHKIIKDILPGIDRKQGEDFWIIVDRREAIRTALVTAKPGDIILIAGKGDEHAMLTNAGAVEWHERTIVENMLKEIDDNTIIQ
ncbi:UDP-N-acetylmuramoyl-L-alanyl-D-glutamate--2,6-diaminopimelate ligase [Candidatus Gracilibacteria bacterium]|nr:UDP-N-acetylmuramoyl-L-alanyl-D-glutamate--2,6-diaminopimelate ligase [Candidatus Gracilibacteria bacterium]